MRMYLKSVGLTAFFLLSIQIAVAQQPPPNQTTQNQAGQSQARIDAANQSIFGRVNQTAWFMEPNIRAQLSINNDQAARLNKAYAQFWNVYNRNQGQFNNSFTLTDAQRQNLLQASNQFYVDFGNASNGILEANQRERFRQLGVQYRGYHVFHDPMVLERLRLTNDQTTRIRHFEREYEQQLADTYKIRATDRTKFVTQLSDLRKDMFERINSVLTDEQRRIWKDMAGDVYTFRIQ